jgi:urea transport system permease protein
MVRQALQQAWAAILVGKTDASLGDRLTAVETLRVRGDQDALALLSNLPAEGLPELTESARKAADGIRSRLAFWSVLQNVWYGVSLGSVLLLAAIGLAITFGTMGIINISAAPIRSSRRMRPRAQRPERLNGYGTSRAGI